VELLENYPWQQSRPVSQDADGLTSGARPQALLKPGIPSSKKRLRHSETDWRETSRRSGITTFDRPSAASRIAFARTTSRNGPE
jgi:hypothetical protein